MTKLDWSNMATNTLDFIHKYQQTNIQNQHITSKHTLSNAIPFRWLITTHHISRLSHWDTPFWTTGNTQNHTLSTPPPEPILAHELPAHNPSTTKQLGKLVWHWFHSNFALERSGTTTNCFPKFANISGSLWYYKVETTSHNPLCDI